jgi:hypothetical protein
VILAILHWAAILFVIAVVWIVASIPGSFFVGAVIALGDVDDDGEVVLND